MAAKSLPPAARKRKLAALAAEHGVGSQYSHQKAAFLVKDRKLTTRKGDHHLRHKAFALGKRSICGPERRPCTSKGAFSSSASLALMVVVGSSFWPLVRCPGALSNCKVTTRAHGCRARRSECKCVRFLSCPCVLSEGSDVIK